MTVSVRWLLTQPDLALELAGGREGLDNEITFAHTTELRDPVRWLSGGELLLTTGLRLPSAIADRATYVRALSEAGVAAIGFGTGLSHTEVPADLIVAADEIGVPLLEVPLPTPFAAVVKRVMSRLAEQEYEAVLRASRAQTRMTRAVVVGGTGATVRELALATSASVILLDESGRVLESHPAQPSDTELTEVREVLGAGTGGSSSSVSLVRSGASITVQQIKVGSTSHGHLVVISPVTLGYVDQILLGHANSLLALDFEKPVRLRVAQNQLNSHALGLLLADDRDLTPAWSQVRQAADANGMLRGMTVVADSSEFAGRVQDIVDAAMNKAGRQVFTRRHESRVTVLLRGTDDVEFARSLLGALPVSARKDLRVGLGGKREVADVVASIEQSRLAASVAESGAEPVDFATLTGRALLTFASTREVLNSLADNVITPIDQHDIAHGTDLLRSLRAFLEANGHWESAAAVVGVHRHTLRSRISRIESLIECDLDNARVRAELLLAIHARQS